MTTLDIEIPARITEGRMFMDTLVTIEVEPWVPRERIDRAFDRFAEVEARCSRFDPCSELRALCARPGEAVAVSAMLFGAVRFALEVAKASGGAFDPTVGRAMQAAGFDRNYLNGHEWRDEAADQCAGVADVILDEQHMTVLLRRALVLDLGALAKGLAIDLASEDLRGLDFCINAGGDLRCAGHNGDDERWRVGIRHPRLRGLLDVVQLDAGAVSTSGDYERPGQDGRGHIVRHADPVEGSGRIASATVIAPTAMVADALSTAVYVLGPSRGLRLLHSQGVEGLLVSSGLEVYETTGFDALRA